MSIENQSGQGKSAFCPPEIFGWNWGVFWLNWIWGLFNGSQIACLVFMPGVGFFVPFYMGYKGNELSWKNKRWSSVEEFKSKQRIWAIAGWVVAMILLAGVAYSVMELQNTERMADELKTQIMTELEKSDDAKELLGTTYRIAMDPKIQAYQTAFGKVVPVSIMFIIDSYPEDFMVYGILDESYKLLRIELSGDSGLVALTIQVVE